MGLTENLQAMLPSSGVVFKPPAVCGPGTYISTVSVGKVVDINVQLLPFSLTHSCAPHLFSTLVVHNISGQEIPEVTCSLIERQPPCVCFECIFFDWKRQ